jgi:hypothetical protein
MRLFHKIVSKCLRIGPGSYNKNPQKVHLANVDTYGLMDYLKSKFLVPNRALYSQLMIGHQKYMKNIIETFYKYSYIIYLCKL